MGRSINKDYSPIVFPDQKMKIAYPLFSAVLVILYSFFGYDISKGVERKSILEISNYFLRKRDIQL